MPRSAKIHSRRARSACAWSLGLAALVFAMGDWSSQPPVWAGIPGLCVAEVGALEYEALAESGAWTWAALQAARLALAARGWGGKPPGEPGPSMAWEGVKRWMALVGVGALLAGAWLAAAALAAPGLGVGLGQAGTRAVLLGAEMAWRVAGPALLAQCGAELLMAGAYAIGARAKLREASRARGAWESRWGVPAGAALLWLLFAALGPAKLENVDCSAPGAIQAEPAPARPGPRPVAPPMQG